MTLDEFVQARVLPQFQDIVAGIRQLMREQVPDAVETVSYGMPVYKKKRIFAYFIPNKKGITFAFTWGTEFDDRYGLLRGTGKLSRYIRLNKLEDVNKEVLGYYIKQALEWDLK